MWRQFDNAQSWDVFGPGAGEDTESKMCYSWEEGECVVIISASSVTAEQANELAGHTA